MKTERIDWRLRHLVTDEEMLVGSGEHWVALMVGDGTYLAAWVDEDGSVKKGTRRSASAAVKLADSSWGR